MSQHLMIDLETMSTKPNAAIVAIGAIWFEPSTITLTSRFYNCISLDSNIKAKRAIDGETIYWWLKQNDEARLALVKDPVSLINALMNFNDFIRKQAVENFYIWGNGANFDPVILGSAFECMNLQVPWNFRNIRCYRTAIALLPAREYIKPTVAHNALEDAKAQAIHLMKIYPSLL